MPAHIKIQSLKEVKEKTCEIARDVVVVLPDIRSAHNIGSIFRTSDAVGVSHIYIAGYSPCPIDRFGRPQKEIAKTALGAEQQIPWTYELKAAAVITRLKKEGFYIIAVEQAESAEDFRKIKMPQKVAFVFGTEVTGIDKKILKKCDVIAEIPMKGSKESLNVSVAAGVALFGMLRP